MSKRRFPADDPERRQWQDPEQILLSIGLQHGMVFVDLGCGEGFFAIPASRRVGREGKVYAIDSNPDAVARLGEQAAREDLPQISTDVGKAEQTVICERCADIVFFGNDLHDFADPEQVIRNAKTMLKPSGHLVDLDWKPMAMEFGPPFEKRFSVEKAKDLIESCGFSVISIRDAGPYHYLILAGRESSGLSPSRSDINEDLARNVPV